jgi:hypothetical protein
MIVDVTYRVQTRNQLKRLRLRFRQPDGLSSVAVYSDPESLGRAATAAALSEEVKACFAEDLNTMLQCTEQATFRLDLEIPADAPRSIGGSDWGPAREFTLSYERLGPDDILLHAKEWNTPTGQMSSELGERMTVAVIQQRLARIGMQLGGVRDRSLTGHSSQRRVSEDEIEELFLPLKSDDQEEESSLGIGVDL